MKRMVCRRQEKRLRSTVFAVVGVRQELVELRGIIMRSRCGLVFRTVPRGHYRRHETRTGRKGAALCSELSFSVTACTHTNSIGHTGPVLHEFALKIP